MHNSWLRSSQVVQHFLQQQGIKSKRTIQEGLFSCVIVLSRQKVLKITVDVYGYLLYLHLIKKSSVNVPKLYKDHGCIGYVTNPICGEEQFPIVVYEMENIASRHLYLNLLQKDQISIKHSGIKQYCFSYIQHINDVDMKLLGKIKALDQYPDVVKTLMNAKQYMNSISDPISLNKILNRKNIRQHFPRLKPTFEWDIHGRNYAIRDDKIIFLDMIQENRLCVTIDKINTHKI